MNNPVNFIYIINNSWNVKKSLQNEQMYKEYIVIFKNNLLNFS